MLTKVLGEFAPHWRNALAGPPAEMCIRGPGALSTAFSGGPSCHARGGVSGCSIRKQVMRSLVGRRVTRLTLFVFKFMPRAAVQQRRDLVDPRMPRQPTGFRD